MMSRTEQGQPYNIIELQMLCDMDIGDLLQCSLWKETRIRETIIQKHSDDESVLLLQLLSKILLDDRYSRLPEVIGLLSTVGSQQYCSKLCELLFQFQTHEMDMRSTILVLQNVANILQHLCSRIPSSALDFWGLSSILFSVIVEVILSNKDESLQEQLSQVQEKAENIKTSISNIMLKPHIEKRKSNIDRRKPPNDFRKISILPTQNDIFDEPFLRKNLTDGAYDNLEHYLDVQFRLLREDCIAQLRNGISEYIKQKLTNDNREVRKLQDVRLYKKVEILKKEITIEGAVYKVQLDPHHAKRIRWESGKRLLYGSLLCLSPDDFHTLYFAVVENVDYEKVKEDFIISIRKERGSSNIPIRTQLTMVESTAHFESYRHVLKCLQNIREGELPFERHIVECKSDVHEPLYMKNDEDVTYDLQPIVEDTEIYKSQIRVPLAVARRLRLQKENEKPTEVFLKDLSSWPTAEDLRLDDSQYKAFTSALTKEFVLIQGPPGTGKTHVGLQIAKTLLHNRAYWMDSNENDRMLQQTMERKKATHPMLIVCYTNHALDQFVEGVVNFMDQKNKKSWESVLVRVGSRCNNPKVAEFSLKNKRRKWKSDGIDHVYYSRSLQNSYRQICLLRWEITMSFKNVIDESVLRRFLPEVEDIVRKFPKFSVINWLKIDERSWTNAAYKDYEKLMFQDIVTEDANKAPQEENKTVQVETEAELINQDRRVEEDEFEIEYTFEETGIRIEHLLKSLQNNPNYDYKFRELLKTQAILAEKRIQENIIMKENEVKDNIKRLSKLSVDQRWAIYGYFVDKYRQKLHRHLKEEEEKYSKIQKEYSRQKQKLDREILQNSTIIAMTTSGAARYQDVLKEVGPKIIIVEEAAEVLEAHIIASLGPNCQHLILIGDHKQLEPKPAVFEIAEKYHLSLSMFERMIRTGLDYVCLERQHRMRPEISQLVRSMYPKLDDNMNVFEYGHISGVEKDVYFITHQNLEYHKDETQSYSNEHEARYIARLTKYLNKQGYTGSQITILTPYSGQMFCIKDKMPKSEFEGVQIAILDNYQGEENDIVLLSLVRSNKEGKIGFLSRDNRICVALSRAKIGLFVIGNFDIIRKFSYKCKLWRKAISIMEQNDSLGTGLPLYCSNHPKTRIKAVNPEDFDGAPEGGCLKACDFRLPCGHACDLYCHPFDKEHKDKCCLQSCPYTCESSHKCKRKCHHPSSCDCEVLVVKTLPCSHKKTIKCHIDPETINCEVVVEKDLPCGHTGEMQCHIPKEDFKCKKIVHRKLKCDHEIFLKCYIDYKRYKCKEIVTKKLRCEHEAEMHCHEDPMTHQCMVDVTEPKTYSYYPRLIFASRMSKIIRCNHLYTRKCSESSLSYQQNNPCKEVVTKKFASCGHDIDLACHVQTEDTKCQKIVWTEYECHHDNVEVKCCDKKKKNCTNVCGLLCPLEHKCKKRCHHPSDCLCDKKVLKQLPYCVHEQMLPCHVDPEEVICKEKVEKKIDQCQHTINLECYKDPNANDIICNTKVTKRLLCGHEKDLPCYEDTEFLQCETIMQKTLHCGHEMRLPCHIDINDSSIECEEMVVKTLNCGHEMILSCFIDPVSATIKCTKNVEKEISCGHKIILPCHENPEKMQCKEIVQTVQPICKHENDIPCYLSKLLLSGSQKYPNCPVVVNVEMKCGHKIEAKCFKSQNLRCKEKCSYKLSCGHICDGVCVECMDNHYHKECQKQCDKTLICGHKCRDMQCGKCRPCNETCIMQCSHQVCKHTCNKPCIECKRPCQWICPHYACTRLCYEPCDRPRCNTRCSKKIKCGHQCLGNCGEPCPNLCGRCNYKEVKKIMKLKSKSSLIQIQECGHTFETNKLDSYMDMPDFKNSYAFKRCPSCSTIIFWHPRYSDILKKLRISLNSMKSLQGTVALKVGQFHFPLVIGNEVSCMEYLDSFGTFLAVNEEEFEKGILDLYRDTNEKLKSMRLLLGKRNRGYEFCHDMYGKFRHLSALWKVFIVFLHHKVDEILFISNTASEHDATKMSEKVSNDMGQVTSTKHNKTSGMSLAQSFTDIIHMWDKGSQEHEGNGSQESGSENRTVSGKQPDSTSTVTFGERIGSTTALIIKDGDYSYQRTEEVESALVDLLPHISEDGGIWIQRADHRPGIRAIIDIHLCDRILCEKGHAVCSSGVCTTCPMCSGIDDYKLQPFQLPNRNAGSDQRERYKNQGARPKTAPVKPNVQQEPIKHNSDQRHHSADNTSSWRRETRNDYPDLTAHGSFFNRTPENNGSRFNRRRARGNNYSRGRGGRGKSFKQADIVFDNYAGSISERRGGQSTYNYNRQEDSTDNWRAHDQNGGYNKFGDCLLESGHWDSDQLNTSNRGQRGGRGSYRGRNRGNRGGRRGRR